VYVGEFFVKITLYAVGDALHEYESADSGLFLLYYFVVVLNVRDGSVDEYAESFFQDCGGCVYFAVVDKQITPIVRVRAFFYFRCRTACLPVIGVASGYGVRIRAIQLHSFSSHVMLFYTMTFS
jgi:hypothetical protein